MMLHIKLIVWWGITKKSFLCIVTADFSVCRTTTVFVMYVFRCCLCNTLNWMKLCQLTQVAKKAKNVNRRRSWSSSTSIVAMCRYIKKVFYLEEYIKLTKKRLRCIVRICTEQWMTVRTVCISKVFDIN